MPFEVRYAPQQTNINIADAFFQGLAEARARQNRQAQQQNQLALRRETMAATDARAMETQAAIDRRHRDMLDARLEEQHTKELAAEADRARQQDDADAIMRAYMDAAGGAPESDGMDAGAKAPLMPMETEYVDTPYGVKVPLVRPRNPAGAAIILNHMAKIGEEKRKAQELAQKNAEKKARAAALMKAYGLDSALGFTDPTDVENFARHQQGGERLRIAEQRLRGAMGRRDLTPEQQNQLQNALAVLSDPNASPAEHSAAYIIAWQHQAAPLAAAVQKHEDPQRTAAAKVAWQKIEDLGREIAAERKPRDDEKYYEDKLAARRDRVAAMEKKRQQLMADYEANFGRTPSGPLPGKNSDDAPPSMSDPATDGEWEAALDALGDSASKEQLAQWISEQRSLGVR